MSIEAMKLMVHELEYVLDCINKDKIPFDGDDFHEALRLGRQAIEQAEKQEPVCPYCHDSHTLGAVYYDQNCVGCVRRMTATPQPQREWVGLTDEDMRELEKQFEAERVRTSDEEYLVIYPAAYWQWQRAIEAKIKEKNYVS